MKKKFVSITFLLILAFTSTQLFCQVNLTDTLENQIGNRYYEVAQLAQFTDVAPYRAYLAKDIKVISQGKTYIEKKQIDSICQPALAAIRGEKVRITKDEIYNITEGKAQQEILVVTLYTDTTRGIPIPNLKRQPKHMKLTIDWTKIDGAWKISSIKQHHWRENE